MRRVVGPPIWLAFAISIVVVLVPTQKRIATQAADPRNLAEISYSLITPICTIGGGFAGGSTIRQDTIFGSRARIERHDPSLCLTDATSPSSSIAWSMVSAASETNPNSVNCCWAQTGYGDFGAAGGFTTFAQYTKYCAPVCDGSNTVTRYGVNLGQVNVGDAWVYSNYLQASTQHILMVSNGTVLAEPNYNPANHWDASWAAEFAAETKHNESNIVGTLDDKVDFDMLQRYEPNGDINFVQCLCYGNGLTATAPRSHAEPYSPAVGVLAFRTWTEPLS